MTNMWAETLFFVLVTLRFSTLVSAQAALGGGAVVPAIIPTQYPTVVVGPSLFTNAAGVTSANVAPFTQTFNSGPLGTWAFPTPLPGTIGLGDIQGTVGGVKSAPSP